VSSHGVKCITIHLPDHEGVPLGDGAEVDEDAAEESRPGVPYISLLLRYFARPHVAIDRPGLEARHMDDLTIREYFDHFNHAKSLPRHVERVYDAVSSDGDSSSEEHRAPRLAGRRRRRRGSDSESRSGSDASEVAGIAASVDSDLADSGGTGSESDNERLPRAPDGRGRGARAARGTARRGRGGARGGRGAGRARGGGNAGRRSSLHASEIWQDYAEMPHWVWPRHRRGVSRLPAIMPTQGETYYLRLLLLRVPARSFDDLYTYDDTCYSTFREAAIARGIVQADNEAATAMQAVVDDITSTPSELRLLFCLYLIHSPDAGDPVKLWKKFWRPMSRDIPHPHWRPGSHRQSRDGLSKPMRKLLLLRRVNAVLSTYNHDSSEYGLPVEDDFLVVMSHSDRSLVAENQTQEDELRSLQSPDEARRAFDAAYRTLTEEQRAIVDYWVSERTARRCPRVFIDALAGRCVCLCVCDCL
jgi:hypothetical protein